MKLEKMLLLIVFSCSAAEEDNLFCYQNHANG